MAGIEIISPAANEDGKHFAYVEKGKQYQIVARVLPEDADDQGLVYESMYPHIAEVDANGLVTAKNLPTWTTVYVRSHYTDADHPKGYEATLRVYVEDALVEATSMSFSPSSCTLDQGARAMLAVVVKPSNAADPGISFESSNPSVVSILETYNYGLYIEGKSAGTATITAKSKDGKLSAKATVTVNKSTVESIVFEPSSITLDVGETSQAKAKVTTSDGKTKVNEGVTFTSTNTSIATVSPSGLVKAVAPGSVRIKGSAGGKTATLVVTVNPQVPKTSTEAIRMLRDNQWKREGGYSSTGYCDELRYEFTEGSKHFYIIEHVRADLSDTKHKYYKYRGQYIGWDYNEYYSITPDSSDPTKGSVYVKEMDAPADADYDIIMPVLLQYSNLTSESVKIKRATWEGMSSTYEGVPEYTFTRAKSKVSFVVLPF